MSKACRTCKGRGRWIEVLVGQAHFGQITHVWHECNDCKGTGVEQDPEAGDNFDIGGNSYADDDE